uniref:Ras family GTPase n=1 Tax=Pithovirus LCPAC304 TaxID=2506594 RepID=A0A481Z9M0_9VIRU|nr:MAG: Ras family GTPase [Pithovirus LCPAC304]
MERKVLLVGSGSNGKTIFVQRLRRIYEGCVGVRSEEAVVVIVPTEHGTYETWQWFYLPDDVEQFDTVVFMFDYGGSDSLRDAVREVKEYKRITNRDFFLVGNKCDLEEPEITADDIGKTQMAFNVRIDHISAQKWTDAQIKEFWEYLVQ